MVDATVQKELEMCLDQMPVERQRQVLDYARTLTASPRPGRHGLTLLQFAGTIDESELDVMSQAIEDGCERIDVDEW